MAEKVWELYGNTFGVTVWKHVATGKLAYTSDASVTSTYVQLQRQLPEQRDPNPLAEAFSALWQAMQTSEGQRICRQRLVEDVAKLCPKDLDPKGWFAAVLADAEGRNVAMVSPWFVADCVSWVITQRDILDPRGIRSAYDRATKRAHEVQGPWIGRRGRR